MSTPLLPTSLHFFERGWLSANNILLVDDSCAVLIDTGYHTHAEQTLELVRNTLGQQPLSHIFNTHLHSDHCGGNSYLQAAFPNVSTHVPPGHAAQVHQWNPWALSYTPTGQNCPRFVLNDVLHSGTHFEIADTKWEIHSAPGHDPHAILIFCPALGILISADALWENGFGVVFPEIEGVHAFQEVADTLDLIERLQPRIVLPGHGSAFTDVDAALARARSKLSYFVKSPEKHAIYAAKVLLKFKLLELQQTELTSFFKWAESAEYLKILHSEYAKATEFEAWILSLCESMSHSGACQIEANVIFNR